MALRYYDDILVAKIKAWTPDNRNLRVLKPDETKRYFELNALDTNDKPLTLPCITLSRNNDVRLKLNIKNPRSYDGLRINTKDTGTELFNVIPVELQYNLEIYTKDYEEGDEYLRNYLFKLINNPVIKINIPYNNANIEHIANIRVLDTVSDTSSISERLFPGQFTKWTIQLEIQDAFLFSIKYKPNWKLFIDENTYITPENETSIFEVAENMITTNKDEIETDKLGFHWRPKK